MSSYVISKQNYSRACGALAGLADNKNVFREPALRIWNYREGRPYGADDFQKAAAWLYHLNARSVMLQYDDEEQEKDPATYYAEFQEAREKAGKLYRRNGAELTAMIYDLQRFFSSVLYQIEDPQCEAEAKGFLYRVSFQLLGLMANRAGHESECWGEFDIA